MPAGIDYDHRQHAVDTRGRALPDAAMAAWMAVFAAHAPARRPLTVADLGSGTGRFTPRLAWAFGGPVYGIEPSARMRTVAGQSARHPAVTYLAGRAEQIPLPSASCDLVLMYLVWHHVQDRTAAAREIARVLRPGGRLLIRSDFPGTSPPRRYWHRYFPRRPRDRDGAVPHPRPDMHDIRRGRLPRRIPQPRPDAAGSQPGRLPRASAAARHLNLRAHGRPADHRRVRRAGSRCRRRNAVTPGRGNSHAARPRY